jgi:hypothetical protein
LGRLNSWAPGIIAFDRGEILPHHDERVNLTRKCHDVMLNGLMLYSLKRNGILPPRSIILYEHQDAKMRVSLGDNYLEFFSQHKRRCGRLIYPKGPFGFEFQSSFSLPLCQLLWIYLVSRFTKGDVIGLSERAFTLMISIKTSPQIHM